MIEKPPAAVAYNQKIREICPNKKKKLNIIENEDEILEINKNQVNNQASKYLGVSYNKELNNYRAYISKNKKTYQLGYYTDEHSAAKSYNSKALELYGAEYKYFNIII